MTKLADTELEVTNIYRVRKKSNSGVASFIFIAIFIAPSPIISVTPKSIHQAYFLCLLFGYILCGIYLWEYLSHKKNTAALVLTLSFVTLGSINLLVHSSNATYNLIGPVSAYIGYCYIQKKRINLIFFDYLLVSMYAVYYFTYYSIIPNLFIRPDFDEGAVYEIASSNTIPIGLNVILYCYMIFNRLYSESKQKKIFYFSVINLLLIIIQQSRAGLIVALIILIMTFYEYNRKKLTLYLSALIPIIVIISSYYLTTILDYLDLIGNINGIEALNEDIRGTAQAAFFEDMDFYTFAFGYSSRIYGTGDLSYTYNVFLDMWNRYGVLELIIFMSVFTSRIYQWRKFHFPLYYFLPFFVYSSIESIFFPSFWDTIIYIPLFALKFDHLQPLEKVWKKLSR